MKKLAVAALAAVTATALLPIGIANAGVPTECSPNHCYGSSSYYVADYDAIGAEIWTDCLHLDPVGGDATVHEIWAVSQKTNPQSWIEAGYARGGIAGGDTDFGFRYYWGEYTSTAYYSHGLGAASTSTWTNFSFYKQANNTWKIYKAGTEVGTSVMTATAGTSIQAGAESSTKDAFSHGRIRYLQYRQSSNASWVAPSASSISGAFGVYTGTASGNAMEQWSMRNTCTGVVLPANSCVTAPPVTTGAVLASREVAPAAVTTATEDAVVKKAKDLASFNGEKAPKITLVKTKRNDSQKLVTGKDNKFTNEDSYMVELSGQFKGEKFPRPQGADVVTGTVMTIVFDAKTGEMTDLSLGNAEKDLGKLGSVKQIS